MTDGNYHCENDEWKEEEEDEKDSSPSLYSLLNLRHDATQEEIHRSYRSLSTSFHPDKIRRRQLSQGDIDMDEIQETFLQFKKAHDVLIDPVLRLAYDDYREYGVELVRRIQQHQRDQKTRRDERNQSDDDSEEEVDPYDGGDDDEHEDGMNNLYERLEDLLVNQNNVTKARKELDQFMEQHDYQRNLTEDNYVHVNVSMTFPPVVPLKPLLFDGRDYLQHVRKTFTLKPAAGAEEKHYYKQRFTQEARLVDYQISQLRSGQKADLGFTLSSVQPPRNNRNQRGKQLPKQPQPSKWSMAIGCNTDLIYPGVAEIANMANAIKNKKKQEEYQEIAQKHPVSAFVNTSYTPTPQTQVFWTANINNDNESHQYSFGSTHTFSNQTACRYGMTYLARSPLPDGAPLIFNIKTYRHLQKIGTTSVGVSASSTGQMLQWNAKWEGTKTSKAYRFVHKASAKANIGLLQGNSLEFGYTCKLPKPHDNDGYNKKGQETGMNFYEWLEENISLPKTAEMNTVLGHFYKINAMVTHELTSLATHPTLGFGMEHDVSLSRWSWIWEIQYNQSTFRIPIPILQLGSIVNPQQFYAQRFYYGIYCLLMQSMVADLLKDHDDDHDEENREAFRDFNSVEVTSSSKAITEGGVVVKTKAEAERQLSLMKSVADKKRYREEQLQQQMDDELGPGGLVILGATYWQKFSQKTNASDGGEDTWVHEIVSMDATAQLQFWVKDSRLSIPSRLPKSSWMGFYNLHTESKLFQRHQKNPQCGMPRRRWWSYGRQRILDVMHRFRTKGGGQTATAGQPFKDLWQDPKLTVRYSYRGSVFEISVGNNESLELPSGTAENLGDALYLK